MLIPNLWLWKSSSCFWTLLLMLRRYCRFSHFPTTPKPYWRFCLSNAKCFTWEAMRRPRRGWAISWNSVGILGACDKSLLGLRGRQVCKTEKELGLKRKKNKTQCVQFRDFGWVFIFTHRLEGCSQGAKEADKGGDSKTSSAMEYNSSRTSPCTEVMQDTEDKKRGQ